MADFSNKQKFIAARGEVANRRWVYPKRVENGKMTQSEMDERIAVMEAITEDYRLLMNAEDRANNPALFDDEVPQE